MNVLDHGQNSFFNYAQLITSELEALKMLRNRTWMKFLKEFRNDHQGMFHNTLKIYDTS